MTENNKFYDEIEMKRKNEIVDDKDFSDDELEKLTNPSVEETSSGDGKNLIQTRTDLTEEEKEFIKVAFNNYTKSLDKEFYKTNMAATLIYLDLQKQAFRKSLINIFSKYEDKKIISVSTFDLYNAMMKFFDKHYTKIMFQAMQEDKK